jgi:biotin-[acetyl-CoA-carboxylase] ligase BirA-like protein
MDVARELVDQGSFAFPFVVTAARQSNGKGRQGAAWESSAGNVMATFAVQLGSDLRTCEGLSLAVGVAVRRACMKFGVEIELKWPNDLLLVRETEEGARPFKVGGVLIELLHQDDRVTALIGIGLNVASTPALVEVACSLNEFADVTITTEEVLCSIIAELSEIVDMFTALGFKGVHSEWLSYAYGLGQSIVIAGDGMHAEISGVFRGIGESGVLQIETVDGYKEIYSGHIQRLARYCAA